MKTRSILTLALLAGCNYDYGLISPDPEIPKTDESSEPPASLSQPGQADSTPEEPPSSPPEEAVDEGTPTGADTGDEELEEALDTGGSLEEDEVDPPLDTGEDGSLEDSPPPDDPPPSDTGVEPDPEPPPPPEEPPVEEEPPPPDPFVPCDLGLPTSWSRSQTTVGTLRETIFSYIQDVDEDGYSDAVWSSQLDNSLRILWGVPGGPDISSPSGWSTVAVGRSEGYISWGDVNGDGWSDFAISNQDSGLVRFVFGNGTRTLGTSSTLPLSGFPQRVLLADVTDDGRTDLLVGLGHLNKTVLIAGNGTGGWSPPVDFIPGSNMLRPVDLDGDGKDELVERQTGYAYDRTGSRIPEGDIVPDPGETLMNSLWPIDLDGDGDSDIVSALTSGGSVRLGAWVNDGGTLTRCGSSSELTFGPGESGPSGVGDLDGDGSLDITAQKGGTTTYIIMKGSR